MYSLYHESDVLINDYIESGWDELLDMLMSGAEVSTNIPGLADEIAEIFPNSVVHNERPARQHTRKKRRKK